MANALYPLTKQAWLAGTTGYDIDVDDSTDGPFVALIDTNDVAYSASHNFYDDIAAAVVGTPMVIDNPTVVTGLFDGADITFSTVSGDVCEALIIYRHNAGANSTWPLICYLDTSVTGLPVTPNGGNITVTWHATGIFQL
jgi:hypothetical protein